MGEMFLIMIDAYSKWMEVFPTTRSTTQVTTESLRKAFAVHGLPDVIISDNAMYFVCNEFK